MLPPTLMPPSPSSSVVTVNGSPTYGDFILRATSQVEAAQRASARPFADATTAHDELLGYERFLHVAGVHLQLLAGLARTPSTPLRKLATSLANLQPDDAAIGRWYDAARELGTAHDLVATHLEEGLLPRTPQAQELLTTRAADRAGRDVAELVLAALSTRQQLFESALRSQRRLPSSQRPITKVHSNHLAKTATTIEVYCMAALWDLNQRAGSQNQESLADVTPAAAMTLTTRSTAFRGSLEALQILRRLVYNQARGTAMASAASLRDLALLGARFTEPTDPLPQPRTGLERVQHAHALDTLESAHNAWAAASRDFTTAVQGLTKAPGTYGAAVHTLLQADPTDSALRPAVVAALPRLGRDAGHTITELGRTGSLLTPQRDVNLRRSWRALPEEAVAELADRFKVAGQATARARLAAQQLFRQTAPASTAPTAPAPTRTRQQHLEIHR